MTAVRERSSGQILGAVIGALATVAAAIITVVWATGGTNPADPAVSVPASYVGTWSGTLNDSTGSSAYLTLSLGDGKIGDRVASIQIPSLRCTYVGSLEAGGASAMLMMQATANTQNLCSAQAEIRVTGSGESVLQYQVIQSCDYVAGVMQCQPRSGSAVLTRAS